MVVGQHYIDSLDNCMFMSKRIAERLGYVSFNCIMFYHAFMSIFYMLIPDHMSNYYVTITGMVHAWVGQKRLKRHILRRFSNRS